jgi:hypothetical protein
MTHINDERVVGNHADMGAAPPAASRKSLTLHEILRAGVIRRTRRREMVSAESVWDSEGGSVSGGAEGPPQTSSRRGR